LAAAAALADVAFAHYRFTSLIVNGTTTAEYEYVRVNTNYNSPVTDVTSDDIRCNVGGLTSGPDTSVATVVAGSTVGFALDIPIFHPGPLAVYMSEVTSGFTVETYDGSGSWFKINELGAIINSTAITFPASNLASYTFEIPSTVPPGAYLLRIEHLALHVAQSAGAAQWYISCAQIQVVGSGGGSPSPTALLPGAYVATDPGILIDIYYPIPTSYTPPGPAVWSGGTGVVVASSSAVTSAATSSKAAPTTISTVVVAPTTVVTSAISGATGATQAKYGQCGGIGWTGPTVCASGSTCTVTNSYYSQCI